jgi:hypothetical protein
MSSVTESGDAVVSTHRDTCPWCCRDVALLVVSGLGRVCPGCYLVFPESGDTGRVIPDE